MLACVNRSLTPVRNRYNEIDQLFGSFFRNFEGSAGGSPFGALATRAAAPMNVWEDDDALHVDLELPGWSMDELEVTVLGDELTLRGERSAESSENVTFHRRERSTGSFRRVLRFPTDVVAEKVTASLRDGVLTVTLPKAEVAKPRKINVQCN